MDVIAIDQQGGKGNCCYAENVMPTLCSDSHGTPHALCYEAQMDDGVICFEPGIAKREGGASRFVVDKCTTLKAEMGDNQQTVCYAIEGNVVDRESAKNGKGWCEDVSPILNTQDRHAVVYALEGNGIRPSHMGNGWNEDGKMYTLNTIERHSVCYGREDLNHKGGGGIRHDGAGDQHDGYRKQGEYTDIDRL